MPNTQTGIYETLVAAFNEGAASLTYANTMLDMVFTGHKPVANATIGETINVNVPVVDEGDVVDIGAGDLETSDSAHNTFPIVFDKKLAITKRIPSWDQIRSPQDLRRLYTDSWLESMKRKINRTLVNLVTSTAFNAYASITAGADVFARANLATAWRYLADGGAPVGDAGNLFFATSPTPYANMFSSTEFSTEATVGIKASEAANQRAQIMDAYGARIRWDQMFPVPSAGTYAGLYFHRHAIAARFGTEKPSAAAHVEEFFVDLAPGIPARVQSWYSPEKQSDMVAIVVCMGCAVVRKEYGAYLVTT